MMPPSYPLYRANPHVNCVARTTAKHERPVKGWRFHCSSHLDEVITSVNRLAAPRTRFCHYLLSLHHAKHACPSRCAAPSVPKNQNFRSDHGCYHLSAIATVMKPRIARPHTVTLNANPRMNATPRVLILPSHTAPAPRESATWHTHAQTPPHRMTRA